MIHLPIEQGSAEWIGARLGIPTASCFRQILTPKTHELSKTADKYMHKLLAERLTGLPEDVVPSPEMVRGIEMEDEAADWYGFSYQPVERAGLWLTNDRRVGCSPDRLVSDDGLIEVKCPMAPTQIKYRLGGPPTDYVMQIQGQLWVTERQWCDLVLYHPTIQIVQRCDRDEVLIAKIAAALGTFCDLLDYEANRLQEMGYELSGQGTE
jgi:hypothetical protein